MNEIERKPISGHLHTAATAVSVAVLWVVFCVCIAFEYSPRTRYTEVAMGSLHHWIAIGAFVVSLGLLFLRAYHAGLGVTWALLGALALTFGVAGYVIEQRLFHAASHPEKSGGVFILLGCLVIAATIGALLSLVYGFAPKRRNA